MAKTYTKDRLINDWEEFFRSGRGKNKTRLFAIMNSYPEKRSFETTYPDLAKFDADLADHLLDYPKASIKAAEEAMMNLMPAESRVPVHFRVSVLPDDIARLEIRYIRNKHVGKLIAIEGLVRRVTEVRPRMTAAAFQCERCKQVTWVEQDEIYFKDPLECDTCHKHPGQTRFKLLTELSEQNISDVEGVDVSEFRDTQKIEVQEPPEGLRGGEQPQRLEMYCEDDIAGQISPGDRVIINGILRNRQRGKGQARTTLFDLFLDINSIEHQGHEYEEIEILPEDEREIKKTAKAKDLRRNMIASIAPSIYGMEIEKEAIALQLFGGVSKKMKDGTRTRGDIHILLVGDPGTAKSQLLSYVSKLAPRGIYASGKSASSAGLTAAAVKSEEFGEGRWTLEAGALVLADRGVCCIDELDKMSPTDRDSMHTAMEQQQISIAKAGITATLQTRCAILSAANPTMGRFDPHRLLPDQIELDPPLLTRFDVIYTITDQIDEVRDRAMAQHITHLHFAGEAAQFREATDDTTYQAEEERIEKEKGPPFAPEFLRKYIAYAKRKIFPVMTPEAMDRIAATYVSMRQKASGGSVPMTPRNIEAMIRLAEANARMHLKDKVEDEDAEVAVRVVMSFLERVAGGEGGGIDTDIITTGYASSQRDRIWSLIEIIKDIQGEDGAAKEDIVRLASERGLPTAKVNEDLERLKRDGRIYEKYDDKFRVA